MHIFMTNDDGFESPGLIEMAKKLARLGRVTVIAPNRGRSSCSSSLSLQTYLRMWHKESYGENISVLSCNGTTADCCKLALEGAVFGIPSIALSADTIKDKDFLEKASSFAFDVIRKYFVDMKYKGTLSLNMPKDKEDLTWENLKVTKLGVQRYQDAIREMKDPSGHLGFWLSGKMLPDAAPDTDVFWIHRGYPTLTALTWNMTDRDNLDAVKSVAQQMAGE